MISPSNVAVDIGQDSEAARVYWDGSRCVLKGASGGGWCYGH